MGPLPSLTRQAAGRRPLFACRTRMRASAGVATFHCMRRPWSVMIQPSVMAVALAAHGRLFEVSGRGESHPSALAEPGMNLSAHPAPIVQPSGRTPNRQWANRVGARFATRVSHRRARRSWRSSRLYFRLAHRTRYSLMRLRSGYNMDL